MFFGYTIHYPVLDSLSRKKVKKVYRLGDKTGRTLIIIFGLLLVNCMVVPLLVVLTCAVKICGLFIFMLSPYKWKVLNLVTFFD